MNATLNVLARVPLLRNWFRQHVQKWQRPHSRLNCFLCAIGRDGERLCGQGHFPGFVPEIVDLRSHWSHEQFAGKRQHDVTEMLSLLFDSLNTIDEIAAAAINPALMQPTNPSRFTTPMWKTLKITYQNRISCTSCGAVNHTPVRDNALFLDVPDDRSHLQDLIKDYWGEQHQPEGDDPYACPREPPCASTASSKNSMTTRNGRQS